MADPLEIAYVLFRFPVLTETFVASEVWALRQQPGISVRLLSLLEPKAGPVHPLAKQLSGDVLYAPTWHSWLLWRAQLYFFVRSPLRYLTLLVLLLGQPYPKQFLGIAAKRVGIFLRAVALARTLRELPVQLIHTHFAWLSGAAARVISQLIGVPFTVTVHAYDIFSTENDLLRFTTSSAARVIAISEFNKQAVLEKCPSVQEESISVIHCGIDLARFSPVPRQDRETLSILSVGSLVAKKGHKYLILACRELAANGVNFTCTIIGGGPNRQELEQLIRESHLEGKVELRGPCLQPEVLRAYHEYDLFVLACVVVSSGNRDGIPVALIEALATQMPVISTPVSGIPELVRHEETGWIVPQRDALALAEAISRLGSDRELCWRLARNGRALVEQEFDIEFNAIRLGNVFRQVILDRE